MCCLNSAVLVAVYMPGGLLVGCIGFPEERPGRPSVDEEEEDVNDSFNARFFV